MSYNDATTWEEYAFHLIFILLTVIPQRINLKDELNNQQRIKILVERITHLIDDNKCDFRGVLQHLLGSCGDYNVCIL